VAAALSELMGNISAVAKRFGVHRSSVQELIDKRPALKRITRDAREGMVDHAESALLRAVMGGEAWAVCFCLKTQGKARGYVERGPDPTATADQVAGFLAQVKSRKVARAGEPKPEGAGDAASEPGGSRAG
jgi:hypothetical protein